MIRTLLATLAPRWGAGTVPSEALRIACLENVYVANEGLVFNQFGALFKIAAFMNAREIIGVKGAALTNIAFAPREAQVTIITPASMPGTVIWFLANLRGQTYRQSRCEQSGPSRGVTRWDTDIIIEEADLAEMFGSALGGG